MLLTPVVANASTLSFINGLIGAVISTTDASAPDYNSQTVPALAAAINVDPNAIINNDNINVDDGSALVPQEGPAGTAADIAGTSTPSNSQISVYIVKQGDTLSGIAELFGVSVNTIIWANDIQNGIIHPGDSLVILPVNGIQHTVVAGDTLASLATKYGSNANDIAQYNGLVPGADLTPGDTIIIPDGELADAESGSSPIPSSTKSGKSSSKSGSHGGIIAALTRLAAGIPTAPLRGIGGPDMGSYFGWPLPSDAGILTQGLHGYDAVDIGTPIGTPILAAADGTVIVAKEGGWNGGYGSYVVIQHPGGIQTLYAHMSKVLATPGESVSKGEKIGLVGETGEATGPHVHFEVRGAVNPFGTLSLGDGDPY